jgi:hypothetical protein
MQPQQPPEARANSQLSRHVLQLSRRFPAAVLALLLLVYGKSSTTKTPAAGSKKAKGWFAYGNRASGKIGSANG